MTTMYRSLAKPESKYYNLDVSSDPGTSASLTANMCRIPAGTGVEQRVGRKIKLLSAEYCGQLTTNNPVRIIMYVPKDQSDELVLANQSSSVDNDKFWVIHDKFYDSNGGNTIFQFRKTFRFGINTEFGGTAGDDINKNGVRLSITKLNATDSARYHTKVWYLDN